MTVEQAISKYNLKEFANEKFCKSYINVVETGKTTTKYVLKILENLNYLEIQTINKKTRQITNKTIFVYD